MFLLVVCSQALARCRTPALVGLPSSNALSVSRDTPMMAAASALQNPCRWIAAANCVASVAASPSVNVSAGSGAGRRFGVLCCTSGLIISGESHSQD